MVERPGKSGKFKARAVAKIKFGKCFKYSSKKAFYQDINRHLVEKNSIWAWRDKAKWGWEIESVELLEAPILVKNIGIKFTKQIIISEK